MLNSNVMKNFVQNRQQRLFESIFLCLAITLSSAFLYFDAHLQFAGIMRAVVFVMIFMVWVWCGFISGKNRQWGFLVFGALYWAVPYLYITYYSARDNVKGYSKYLSFLNKFADLFFDKPMRIAADYGKCDTLLFVLALIMLTVIAYNIGNVVAAVWGKCITDDACAGKTEEAESADSSKENLADEID